jgi:site-specific DNA recombinase
MSHALLQVLMLLLTVFMHGASVETCATQDADPLGLRADAIVRRASSLGIRAFGAARGAQRPSEVGRSGDRAQRARWPSTRTGTTTAEDAMKSVAIYARVSSEQQARQATVESQLVALKQRAESEGHIVLPQDIYVDEGFSGATLKRPALERLRDRAAEGAIERLYVHSPDRLARKYAYQVLLLDELRTQGVTPIFLHGPAGKTAEDELLVQVQGMIAEYERAKILERCRRGKLHRARQGLVNSMSGAPYGYAYIKKSETAPASYQVLLHEAKVVREVFNAFVFEQKFIAEIVRMLNAQQTPTRRGAARWDRTTVWAMLQNPAYAGKAAFGKTEAVERGVLLRPIRGKKFPPRHAKSTYRDKPKEQWIHIDVPALVSRDLFEAAQGQLERNKRLASRNGRGERYLLQGLTVCAQCGYAFYGKMISRPAAKGKRRYAYYRCVGSDGYRFAGGRLCHNPHVRAEQLDGYVWQSVCELLQQPERMLAEWSRRIDSDGASTQLRESRDDAARIVSVHERSLRRLVDAYEAGAIELPDLQTRSEGLRVRLERARRDLADTEQKLNETVHLRAVITQLDDFAARVRNGLDRTSWVEQQRIIRTLVAQVKIDENGATVIYRLPAPTGKPGGADPEDQSGAAEGSASKNCQLRGGRAFAASCERILARGTGRMVRRAGPAAAERSRVSDPLCGRRGARVLQRGGCSPRSGRVAEAIRQIRPDAPPGENPARALS